MALPPHAGRWNWLRKSNAAPSPLATSTMVSRTSVTMRRQEPRCDRARAMCPKCARARRDISRLAANGRGLCEFCDEPKCPIERRFSAKSRWNNAEKAWRPEAESNRCTRICSPLHSHSAIRPQARARYRLPGRLRPYARSGSLARANGWGRRRGKTRIVSLAPAPYKTARRILDRVPWPSAHDRLRRRPLQHGRWPVAHQ